MKKRTWKLSIQLLGTDPGKPLLHALRRVFQTSGKGRISPEWWSSARSNWTKTKRHWDCIVFCPPGSRDPFLVKKQLWYCFTKTLRIQAPCMSWKFTCHTMAHVGSRLGQRTVSENKMGLRQKRGLPWPTQGTRSALSSPLCHPD